MDYEKLSNMLELQDWEREDPEYIDYLLVDYIQDWLLSNHYQGTIGLSNYLYDKIYDIDRLGYIGDYLSKGIIYNELDDFIQDILYNILDSLELIAYNDDIGVYDIIHGIDDSLLVNDGYKWTIVGVNYNNDTFIINEIEYNLNDTMRI